MQKTRRNPCEARRRGIRRRRLIIDKVLTFCFAFAFSKEGKDEGDMLYRATLYNQRPVHSLAASFQKAKGGESAGLLKKSKRKVSM